MAPVTGQSGDVGDSFSSNFLSNLAPILTLFGEQVTKQFLSQITGWGDSIVFSMAPTGILSGVVSAIRLGGSASLKTLVGRARENKATVEKELLSTTSDSVCEMWTDGGIVRMAGRPMTREFIYRPRKETWKENNSPVYDGRYYFAPRVFDLYSLWSCGLFQETSKRVFSPEDKFRLVNQAPNLTVNGPRFHPGSWDLIPVAVIVQLSVIVAAGIITFHYNLYKNDRPFPPLPAYITFTIGTSMIVIGLVACCHGKSLKPPDAHEMALLTLEVPDTCDHRDASRTSRSSIDRLVVSISLDHTAGQWYAATLLTSMTSVINSAVRRYELETPDSALRVVRLQKAMRINDEDFKSYAILNEGRDNRIRLWRAIAEMPAQTRVFYERWTIGGSAITITGFVAQFVGSLGLHFSISVTVVLASAVMLVLRACASLGLAAGLIVQEIPEGHELAHLTTRLICELATWGLKFGEIRSYRIFDGADCIPIDSSLGPAAAVRDISEKVEISNYATEAIMTRMMVQKLASTVVSHADLGAPPTIVDTPEDMASWGEWHTSTALPVPWPDDYIELAYKLNTAICNIWDIVINRTGDSGHLFQFVDPDTKKNLFAWENQVHYSTLQDPDAKYQTEASIYLEEDQKGTLSINVAKVAAMLSLSHYNILSQQQKTSHSPPKCYYRLYGVFKSKEDFYVNHMRLYDQWIGTFFQHFTVNVETHTLEDHRNHVKEVNIANSPVFGFNLYSDDPDIYPPKESSFRNYAHLLSPSDPTLHLPFAIGAPTSPSTGLPVLLAQEILQNFLLCLCIRLKPIRGTTYPAERDKSYRPPDIETLIEARYRNTAVEALCKCLVEADLVNGLDEARSLVVPIFLNRGLLTVQPLIDEIWKRGRR